MNDLAKLLAVITAAVLVKRLLDGKPVCLSAGPFKVCNY